MKKKVIILFIIILICVIATIGLINKKEMYVVNYISATGDTNIAIFQNEKIIFFEKNIEYYPENEEELKFYKTMLLGAYEELSQKYNGFYYNVEETDEYIKAQFKIDYLVIDKEGEKILDDGLKSKEKFLDNIKNEADKISNVDRYIIIYGLKIKC